MNKSKSGHNSEATWLMFATWSTGDTRAAADVRPHLAPRVCSSPPHRTNLPSTLDRLHLRVLAS
jgi:hypothetical protein